MQLLKGRGVSLKASNVYLTFILQFIVFYIRVCVSTDDFENIINEDIDSENLRSNNLLFGRKKNLSLLSESQVIDAKNQLTVRPGMVRFSPQKPQSSPKAEVLKRNNNRNKKRSRVNMLSDYFQDVCPSVSDWVARTEALDPYGNKLAVVQRIKVNGTVINQYFYETLCSYNVDYYDLDYSENHLNFNQNTQCRGIDKKEWSSRCRENYIWTYGKVVTGDGDTGWSVIAIRGSCGCAIWPNTNAITRLGGRGRRVTSDAEYRGDNDPFF